MTWLDYAIQLLAFGLFIGVGLFAVGGFIEFLSRCRPMGGRDTYNYYKRRQRERDAEQREILRMAKENKRKQQEASE